MPSRTRGWACVARGGGGTETARLGDGVTEDEEEEQAVATAAAVEDEERRPTARTTGKKQDC